MTDTAKANWLKLTPESFPKEMQAAYAELREAFETVAAAKAKFHKLGVAYVDAKLAGFAKAITDGNTPDEQKKLAAKAIADLRFNGKTVSDGYEYSFGFRYGPSVAAMETRKAKAKSNAISL